MSDLGARHSRGSLLAADSEAKRRWGPLGVAIVGQSCMVGYFVRGTPDHPSMRPPFPWVKCGEGPTWTAAFEASDSFTADPDA